MTFSKPNLVVETMFNPTPVTQPKSKPNQKGQPATGLGFRFINKKDSLQVTGESQEIVTKVGDFEDQGAVASPP